MFDRFLTNIASTLRSYWLKYETTSSPVETTEANLSKVSSRENADYQIIKTLLRVFPWILFLGFLTSFFWDFNQLELQVFSEAHSLEGLLRMLSVSGLIGYVTNWLAITMLFKPVTKRPILGQGLVPRQKNRIAVRLADTISTELLSPKHIKDYIHSSELLPKLKHLLMERTQKMSSDIEFREEIKEHIHDLMVDIFSNTKFKQSVADVLEHQIHKKIEGDSLNKLALKTYTFIKGAELNELLLQSLDTIPQDVHFHLEQSDTFYDQLPHYIEQNIHWIEQRILVWTHELIHQLDIFTYIKVHLESYDESQIESLIRNSTNEELRYIQQLGAVIGFVGGCIIWKPLISMITISILITSMYLLDQLLSHLSTKRTKL